MLNSMMKKGVLAISLLGMSQAVFANAAPAPDMSNFVGQWGMLAVFIAVFYFMIIRPQQKRTKEHQSLISNLSKGDEVVTTGGIIGKVSRVADNFLVVTISEGTDVNVQKQAVAMALPKGTIKSI